MKNLTKQFFMAALLLGALLLFTSCEKEQLQPQELINKELSLEKGVLVNGDNLSPIEYQTLSSSLVVEYKSDNTTKGHQLNDRFELVSFTQQFPDRDYDEPYKDTDYINTVLVLYDKQYELLIQIVNNNSNDKQAEIQHYKNGSMSKGIMVISDNEIQQIIVQINAPPVRNDLSGEFIEFEYEIIHKE